MMKPCLFLLAAACCGVLAAGETPEPPAPPWGKLILGPDTTVPEVIGHVMPHHVPAVLSSESSAALRANLAGAVPAGDLVLSPKGGKDASMLIRSGSTVIYNDPKTGTTFNSTDGKPGIPIFLHNAKGEVVGPVAVSPDAGSAHSAMPKNPESSSKPVSRQVSPVPDTSSRRTFSNMPEKPDTAPSPAEEKPSPRTPSPYISNSPSPSPHSSMPSPPSGSSSGSRPFRAPSPYIK